MSSHHDNPLLTALEAEMVIQGLKQIGDVAQNT